MSSIKGIKGIKGAGRPHMHVHVLVKPPVSKIAIWFKSIFNANRKKGVK